MACKSVGLSTVQECDRRQTTDHATEKWLAIGKIANSLSRSIIILWQAWEIVRNKIYGLLTFPFNHSE